MQAVVFVVLAISGALCQPSQAQSASSEKSATKGSDVYLQLPAAKPESHSAEIVKAICELIAALAWPAVITALLIANRKLFPKLVGALTALVERSDHVKFLELIDIEANRSATKADQKTEISSDISAEDRDAADRVGGLISEVKLSDIQKRMSEYAQDYETTRETMQPGPDRTRAMNAIVARMHTLAILAKPLLSIFAASEQPGKRLAAISILELSPSLDYVPWLVERMSQEKPFLLFHASLALREAVRKYKTFAASGLRAAVSQSLQVLERFERETGQVADRNTRMVLRSGLLELGEGVSA